MLLIGDIIIGARELIPDLPRTLAAMSNGSAAVVAAGGSTLPAGTYSVVITATNRWGETLASAPIINLVVGANQGIQVTGPTVLPVTSTGYRAYFALNGQPYTQFQASATVPFTISSPGYPGTPPNRSTAFYPDSDGNLISAYTIYRWLNEALSIASQVAEGIPDTSGLPTVTGQGLYTLPGTWEKLFHCWWDGFPGAFAGSADMFYRNRLSGNIPFLSLVQYNAEKVILEMQPQPGRSGGSSTLSAQLAVGGTQVTAASLASFGLSLGLAIVGNYPVEGQYEIIEYSQLSGNQLLGCARGLGGTVESTWPSSTPIVEANYRFSGQRQFNSPTYFPGMSMSGLKVPSSWQRPLVDYILNKTREAEQSPQEAQRKLQEFSGLIKASMKANELVAGPRQVGGTSYPGDGYATSGGFRVIVP